MTIFAVTGNISKDKRAALGQVCIHWAILEQRIEQVIWAFEGIDRKTGRHITASMSSVFPRVNLMLQKSDQSKMPTADKKLMNALARQIKKHLALERNWAVHGIWGKGLEPGMRRKIYAISYHADHEGNHREMSVEYLNSLAERIKNMTYVLEQFITLKLGVPLP